jgi:UDP-GlcNAc:undecaprenyl-phosphate GlcNAc-1-phosphate transferase
MLKGKSPVSADKTHLHHRLLAMGFSHALVVIIIYVFAFSFGLLALSLSQQAEWLQMLAGLLACAVLYACLWFCELKKIDFSRYKLLSQEHIIEDNVAKLAGKSLKALRFVITLGLLVPIFFVDAIPVETHNLLLGVLVLLMVAYPWQEHTERLNIVYGLFYLTGLTILYVWNLSTYSNFSLAWYTFAFIVILSIWSILKIRFKGNKEAFLTSGLEVILVFTSWFIPFTILPVLQVSEEVMTAAKTSCLEAIPLFIAMKIVIRRHPDRNYMMVAGLLMILLLMLVVL